MYPFYKREDSFLPADTARNQGDFTTHALWSVESFNFPTVCAQFTLFKARISVNYNIYFNTFCNTQIEKYCNSAILIIEAANLKVDPRADVKDEDT